MPLYNGSNQGACPHCGRRVPYGFEFKVIANAQEVDDERYAAGALAAALNPDSRPKVLLVDNERRILVCGGCGKEVAGYQRA